MCCRKYTFHNTSEVSYSKTTGFNMVWRTCVAESILFITPARGLIQKQKVLLRFRTHVLAKACFLRHQRGVSFKNNRFQYGGAAMRRCRTTGRKTKAPHRFELMGPKRIILFFTKFGYAEIYSVILGFGGVFFMGRRFFVPMKWQQVDIRNGHNFSL